MLDQEQRIIGFAREGKATCRPLAAGMPLDLGKGCEEQEAAVAHVWNSTDRVMLIRGGAGTGKTTAMTPALAKLGCAGRAAGSVGQGLAYYAQGGREGARVLRPRPRFWTPILSRRFSATRRCREAVKNGGIIWVDEAGMLAIDDLESSAAWRSRWMPGSYFKATRPSIGRLTATATCWKCWKPMRACRWRSSRKIQRQKGEYAGIVAAISATAIRAGR